MRKHRFLRWAGLGLAVALLSLPAPPPCQAGPLLPGVDPVTAFGVEPAGDPTRNSGGLFDAEGGALTGLGASPGPSLFSHNPSETEHRAVAETNILSQGALIGDFAGAPSRPKLFSLLSLRPRALGGSASLAVGTWFALPWSNPATFRPLSRISRARPGWPFVVLGLRPLQTPFVLATRKPITLLFRVVAAELAIFEFRTIGGPYTPLDREHFPTRP
jgi:hypothetical protein